MSGSCIELSQTPAQLNVLLPAIGLSLGGSIQLTLTAVSSYIMYVPDGAINYYCPGIGYTSSSFTVLGWSIINQFITIFDVGNSRIGFSSSVSNACELALGYQNTSSSPGISSSSSTGFVPPFGTVSHSSSTGGKLLHDALSSSSASITGTGMGTGTGLRYPNSTTSSPLLGFEDIRNSSTGSHHSNNESSRYNVTAYRIVVYGIVFVVMMFLL